MAGDCAAGGGDSGGGDGGHHGQFAAEPEPQLGNSAKGVEYRPGQLQGTFVFIVSPGYLKAIGMRLVEGRDFRWDDDNKPPPVIINETVARALWPGKDPIGRIAEAGGTDVRVMGVIADVHETSVEGGAGWQMYLPVTERSLVRRGRNWWCGARCRRGRWRAA